MDRLLLTVPEAAQMLCVSRTEVYRLINRGVLPAVRLSARITRIPREAIDRVIAAAMGEGR
jgi:excisionase family DNA binding protein